MYPHGYSPRAYRAAYERPKARIGPQDEPVGGARVWVLPNPSGLNAHWTLATIAGELRRLRASYLAAKSWDQ
ncbi:hypothetical protein ACFLIM_42715 [Nonomuraea sp. M3C6]|uniref:Uncharacterized protein n=1 Tax=Nonomuraea marmarensis TaxID=3351344 RepID=A0ABW7AUY0_9ACTN